MAPTKEKEEKKLSLHINDPQAGYIQPDLSLQDDTGVLPDDLQEWNDARDEARAEAAETVANDEDKVRRDAIAAEAETTATETSTAPKKAETSSAKAS